MLYIDLKTGSQPPGLVSTVLKVYLCYSSVLIKKSPLPDQVAVMRLLVPVSTIVRCLGRSGFVPQTLVELTKTHVA
jgi:hypothetical protein